MTTVTIVSAGRPLLASWACAIETVQGSQQLSGLLPGITHHEAILRGTIAALDECTTDPLRVRSNNRYLIDGINTHIRLWTSSGWTTAAGTPVLYETLWRELTVLCRTFDHIEFEHLASGEDAIMKAQKRVARSLLAGDQRIYRPANPP